MGYPSFSKYDDKIAFSALSTSDIKVVGVVKLAENKISSNGENASLLINNAKWPVYYSTGKRALGLEPIANFTADYLQGASPFEVKFFDMSINSPSSWSWNFEGGSPSVSTEQNPIVSYSAKGIYTVSLTVQNSFGNNTLTKTSYIKVDQKTGKEAIVNDLISYYPNPVENTLMIKCDDTFVARIIDFNGKVCIYSENKTEINVSTLTKGIYILELKVNEQIIRDKLIKL